jgi:hypothetical protein
MIAELNKIAIIHLFLLGFEDELGSFQLSLTNPSKQADLLTIDVWKEKMLLYKDAVTPVEGIAPTSQTWAKKHILGFSDEEIKLDLQQQRIEKAVSAEIQNTPNVITRTGLFDNVDKLYGSTTGSTTTQPEEGGADASLDFGAPTETPPAEPAAITPESKRENNMSILLELDNFGVEEIDLEKGRRSLGDIENTLGKLMD